MKVCYIINNYQLGAKLKTTYIDKIVKQERMDSNHIKIVYEVNEREKQFIDRVFGKNGKPCSV